MAVADAGSLAGAGSRLNRSPSAVSMMLKQFEDHLGQALFETDRKRDLSALGLFVLEQARSELRQFDRSVTSIEQYARTGIGVVRVAAVPSVAGTVLPVALATFLGEHPDIRVKLGDMDSSHVLQALEQGRVDLGIASAADRSWTAGRSHLFDDEFGLVCRADHALAAQGGPLGWAALANEPFIGNELCERIDAKAPRALCARARLFVQNTGSLLAMVREGLGVTVLPRTVMALPGADLSFRPMSDPCARRRIDLLYRTGGTMSSLTETLVRHVVAAALPSSGA